MLWLAVFFAVMDPTILPAMEEVECGHWRANKYNREQIERLESIDLANKRRLVSYNVLYPDYRGSLTDPDYTLAKRIPRIMEWLACAKPDILLLQELHPQLLDSLAKSYTFIGKRQTKAGVPNEWVGVAFRSEVYACENMTLSLIDDPYVAGVQRALVVVVFKDLHTGKRLQVATAHTSFSHPDSRLYFLRQLIATLDPTLPTMVGGDLNTFSHLTLSSVPFLDGDYLWHQFRKAGFWVAKEVALLGHFGPLSSFTNDPSRASPDPFCGEGTPGIVLDPVFVKGAIVVVAHGIDPAQVDGYYPSDHMPVIVDFLLEEEGHLYPN